MKILIVYASVGAGHKASAVALYNYLKENRKDCKLNLVDILDTTNFVFRAAYRQGYSFLVRRIPVLWGIIFCITDIKPFRALSRGLARINNRLNSKHFSQFLIKEEFDYIISTHFFPSDVSAFLKINGKISAKLISIITDFQVHNYWVCKGTDLYVAACGATAEMLRAAGVKADKIREFGIPVDKKFFASYDKPAVRRKLGLEPDKFICLLMAGSFGTGPLKDITLCLCAKMQVIVVCALNKKLFNDLNSRNLAGVKVFGFVENPQELMAAADSIVTKPGGLSISEAIAMELAPIFISTIPGQETGNIRVLNKYKIGLAPWTKKEVCDAVLRFKENPGRLNAAREAVRLLRKPDCLKAISECLR